MNKLKVFLKEKQKLIIVVLLIILLAFAVYMLFGGTKDTTATVTTISQSDNEIKLTNILESMDGVGETSVMITETDGVITGVVIVCEGGNSILVKNNILNVVSTAFGIDKNIIAIYSM